jgi:Uma2 family endonuclease
MSLTLEDFLTFPDTKPASEYFTGQIIQKPMTGGKHSLIRSELMMVINQPYIMVSFPELRCVFAGCAIVPDLAIFECKNIPYDEDGTIANDFNFAPDWIIEISSLGRSVAKMVEKTLHCLQHGTKTGWLIDVDKRSIHIYHANGKIEVINKPAQSLATPDFAKSISLTVGDIFGFLKLN